MPPVLPLQITELTLGRDTQLLQSTKGIASPLRRGRTGIDLVTQRIGLFLLFLPSPEVRQHFGM